MYDQSNYVEASKINCIYLGEMNYALVPSAALTEFRVTRALLVKFNVIFGFSDKNYIGFNATIIFGKAFMVFSHYYL